MTATDRRSRDGKRLYACDGPGCGCTHEPWGRTWVYYGAIEGDSPLTFCGWECAQLFSTETGEIPMPTPDDMKSKLGQSLQKIIDGPMRGSGIGNR